MSVGPGMMGVDLVCRTRREGQSLSGESRVVYEETLPLWLSSSFRPSRVGETEKYPFSYARYFSLRQRCRGKILDLMFLG